MAVVQLAESGRWTRKPVCHWPLPAAEQLPRGRAGAAGVLDGIGGPFAARDGFGAGVRCEQELGHEFCRVIAGHAEEVDDPLVEIVVDLDFGGVFAEQDASPAHEWFAVGAMSREVADDPGRQPPFRAVVAEWWVLDHGWFSRLVSRGSGKSAGM